MSKNPTRERMVRMFTSDLQADEQLVPLYCVDIAGCECEAVDHFISVGVIPVGRRMRWGGAMRARRVRAGGAIDRCLLCGAEWLSREWVGDPLVIVTPAAAAEVAS